MLSSATPNDALPNSHLDKVFKALGDRTRRDLLARLADGPTKITDLAEPYDMSLPAVAKHIRVLEKAGLIERTVSGRVHRCELNAAPLRTAGDWLMHYQKFWDETLDSLSVYLESESERGTKSRGEAS